MGQSSGGKFVATKQQLPDVDVHVEAMTSTRGLIWRRLWSMWESCLRPGRHWKEQDWPQVPNRRYEEPIKEAVPIPPELVHHSPQSPFNLDESRFFFSQFEICEKKRGAVGGPSGDDRREPPAIARPHEGCKNFSRCQRGAQVPPSVRDTVRLGRFTALQKPDGGVRGIVARDVVRRLVARSLNR